MPIRSLCFEVVPANWDGVKLTGLKFKPVLMDVPSIDPDRDDAAARRAWWSAFHLLGPKGVEPEDYEVYEYSESFGRGAAVDMKGFVDKTKR